MGLKLEKVFTRKTLLCQTSADFNRGPVTVNLENWKLRPSFYDSVGRPPMWTTQGIRP